MSHEARQVPSWLIFDVRQAMRAIAVRGAEGEKVGESSLRVIHFSRLTLVGESGAAFLVGERGLGVVRVFGREFFSTLDPLLEPVGSALVGDGASRLSDGRTSRQSQRRDLSRRMLPQEI